MEKPIDTLKELANSDLNLLILNGTFFTSLFEGSKDATYESIGRKWREAYERGYTCANHMNCLKTVNENKKYAYIMDGDFFNQFYLQAHDLQFIYKSKSKFYTSAYAIVLRKNFPILKHFNQKIQMFLEMGFINKWKEDFSQVYINVVNNKDKKTRVQGSIVYTNIRPPISMDHLQGIFLIASIGFGMSLMVFTGEKLFY
nr:uncharacterized protein LOC121117000 [Lepeophtheirus salmonis]